MIKLNLPDKHIRKYLYALIRTLNVEVFDSMVSGNDLPKMYVLLSSQSNNVTENTKCGARWETNVLINVVDRFGNTSNAGNRAPVEDLTNDILTLLRDKITLDGGLNVLNHEIKMENDITSGYNNLNVHRKLIRLNLTIN